MLYVGKRDSIANREFALNVTFPNSIPGISYEPLVSPEVILVK